MSWPPRVPDYRSHDEDGRLVPRSVFCRPPGGLALAGLLAGVEPSHGPPQRHPRRPAIADVIADTANHLPRYRGRPTSRGGGLLGLLWDIARRIDGRGGRGRPRVLTPEKRARLHQQRKRGWSYARIAASLGVSAGTVYREAVRAADAYHARAARSPRLK